MPSLLKTAFLELSKWAGNEYPKREDFVSDNEKIDAFADDISSQMAQIATNKDTATLNQLLASNGDGTSTFKTITTEGAVKGVDGKQYKIVAGTIYNDAGTWKVLSDAEHSPVNILSVTGDDSKITLYYNFTASKVVSFIAVPDDTLVRNGFNFGSSVGLNMSYIYPSINKTIGGYIAWDGTSWSISDAKGVTSAIWNATTSTLDITHENMYYEDNNANNVQISVRDGLMIPCLGSVGLTTIPVQFRDYDGALITTLSTDMKFYLTRMTTNIIKPSKLNIANANIWIYGIFEIPSEIPSLDDYMYNLGVEYETWSQGVNTSSGTGTASISKQPNHLLMQASMTSVGSKNIGYSTDEKVDLSAINTLYIDMDVTVVGSSANCLVGLDPNSRIDSNNYYSDLIVKTSNGNTGRVTHAIDVSAMNDARYIKFICGASGAGSTSNVKVYSVWGI